MRPVIIVDGTFLTARYRGTLIIAPCQDENMQIYPLAWAIVDFENDDAWTWFFTKLKAITGGNEGLVIISDRHRSIITVVKYVFQNVHHAHCIYHIKGNLKTATRKPGTFALFMRAAEVYTKEEFRKHMSQIEKADEKCWEYLSGTIFETWAMSHCKGNPYNIMTSNNVESLNSVYKDARQTPIIPLLQSIEKTLQKWFCDRRELAQACTTYLTLVMETKISQAIENANNYTVIEPIDQSKYVVRSGPKHYTVDFVTNACSCGKFQLYHVPCEHAVAVANRRKFSVHRLCSSFYTADCWKLAYYENIYPVANEEDWDIPESVKEMTILPPLVRVPAGRRRTKRIRSSWRAS